jgi:hypothetical protein
MFKSDKWHRKETWVCGPNYINQLQLNPQINKNNEKFKAMNKRKPGYAKRQLTNEKMAIASTYFGHVMLWFQDKECIMAPYNFK